MFNERESIFSTMAEHPLIQVHSLLQILLKPDSTQITDVSAHVTRIAC